MPSPKKNNGRSRKVKSEEAPEIGKLAECVLEALQKEVEKEDEPFETYAHQLKVRILSNNDLFRDRFVKGYGVLMETIRKHQ